MSPLSNLCITSSISLKVAINLKEQLSIKDSSLNNVKVKHLIYRKHTHTQTNTLTHTQRQSHTNSRPLESHPHTQTGGEFKCKF